MVEIPVSSADDLLETIVAEFESWDMLSNYLTHKLPRLFSQSPGRPSIVQRHLTIPECRIGAGCPQTGSGTKCVGDGGSDRDGSVEIR
jgi:hypothetical protein